MLGSTISGPGLGSFAADHQAEYERRRVAFEAEINTSMRKILGATVLPAGLHGDNSSTSARQAQEAIDQFRYRCGAKED